MEMKMDDTAQLRIEIALLRARVDALQTDLLDLVALHGQTLEAVARLSRPTVGRRQEYDTGD